MTCLSWAWLSCQCITFHCLRAEFYPNSHSNWSLAAHRGRNWERDHFFCCEMSWCESRHSFGLSYHGITVSISSSFSVSRLQLWWYSPGDCHRSRPMDNFLLPARKRYRHLLHCVRRFSDMRSKCRLRSEMGLRFSCWVFVDHGGCLGLYDDGETGGGILQQVRRIEDTRRARGAVQAWKRILVTPRYYK